MAKHKLEIFSCLELLRGLSALSSNGITAFWEISRKKGLLNAAPVSVFTWWVVTDEFAVVKW